MKKLLTLSVLLMSMAVMSLSQSKIANKVIKYQKTALSKNPNIKLNSISVSKTQSLSVNKDWGEDWNAYTLNINLKYRGKNIDITDILFSNGELVSPDLFDIDTGESIKSVFEPKVVDKYYDDSHLLVGNSKATHKLLVFSDMLCPACQSFIPSLIKFAKKNKNDLALYYYNFPLISIHPNAATISKMSLVAKQRGMNYAMVKEKLYKAKISSKITKDKVFKRVNSILSLSGKKAITKKDFTSDIIAMYKKDLKLGNELGVSGTPTLYTNGEKDASRSKYKNIIK